MKNHLIRAALGGLALSAVLVQATAQDKAPGKKKAEAPDEPYSEFFRTPKTAEEFWRAIQFELDVGRPDQAARALRGLMASNPTDEALAELEKRVGASGLLRLRTVPRWSDNEKVNKQAVQDAEDLAKKVSAAAQRVQGDQKRIASLIPKLNGDADERSFASRELYQAKDAAIPGLVRALQEGTTAERTAILDLMPKLSPDTVPAVRAALRIPDDKLRTDLIDVLVRRHATEAAPDLWWPSASPKVSESVRRQATQALETLLDRPSGSLPAAPAALTREAERYAKGQVPFTDRANVPVWRTEGQNLVRGWPDHPTIPASRAEEYYGLHYARQALDLDPRYEPAQEAFLNLALKKAMERAGPDQPVKESDPGVQGLLSTVNSGLVNRVLERGLEEHQVPVILGTVRALGDLGDSGAFRPTAKGNPPLLRALEYPDRRVQMAAADAVLRIPTPPPPTAAGRVVDILKRNAVLEPAKDQKPKALVGFATDAQNQAVAQTARRAGLEPVTVRTGCEALKRLAQAADIDALILDADLANPELTFLLGQLRADINTGRLPIWLVVPAVTRDVLIQRRTELNQVLAEMPGTRRDLQNRLHYVQEDLGRTVGPREPVLRQEIADLEVRLAHYSPDAESHLLAERRAIEQELLTAPCDYALSLRRWLARYHPNVQVISDTIARSPEMLQRAVNDALEEGDNQPLTEAERRDFAERSLRWLARIARGEVAGYDVRPAEDALLHVLKSPNPASEAGLIDAVEAVGRLPGGRPQSELAAVLLDGRRPAAVRRAAAGALRRHIQTHSPGLRPADVQGLQDLYAAPNTDPALREDVGLVLGSLRPGDRLTGERLRSYEPSPVPAKPAPKKGL